MIYLQQSGGAVVAYTVRKLAEMAGVSVSTLHQYDAIMARTYEGLRAYYEPGPGLFEGLGRLHAEDERFRKHYEDIAHGLAEYLRRAMQSYARAVAR